MENFVAGVAAGVLLVAVCAAIGKWIDRRMGYEEKE